MLNVKNLSKTFLKGTPNEHTALQNLSLHLEKGDFVTVIGSNGAGKSTLFNAIAGSFLCEAGSIVLDGADITYKKEHQRAKQIGRIFQDPMKGTAPDLTVEENLALAYAKSMRNPFTSARRRKDVDFYRAQLARLDMGLEERMRTKMGQLSGGQRQAVTLLMSTIVTPKLLLLDEHTAALDPATAEKVLALTRQTVERGQITTLMVTHNIASALSLGNRTIMMEGGALALELDPQKRPGMSVGEVLALFQERAGKQLDNDRILLAR